MKTNIIEKIKKKKTGKDQGSFHIQRANGG